MCNFFACLSDGFGNLSYFDWNIRRTLIYRGLGWNGDSHPSIVTHFGLNEGKCNKWTYNPLTKATILVQMNTRDDADLVKNNLSILDFSKIVPQLIIKPVVRPFDVKRDNEGKVNSKEFGLLEEWTSVYNLIENSVTDLTKNSVWDSIKNSVWDLVWTLVCSSVIDLYRDLYGYKKWESEWDCARNLVWDSIWNCTWAYTGSFINPSSRDWKCDSSKANNKNYPFSSCVLLWEVGLIPSFDGKVWRLHSGEKAEIIYEWVSRRKEGE